MREKHDYEGNEIVASNGAYANGLRRLDDIAGKSVAISQLGSTSHYQLGQIARAKRFDLTGITLKSAQTLDGMARARSPPARSMLPSCRCNYPADLLLVSS